MTTLPSCATVKTMVLLVAMFGLLRSVLAIHELALENVALCQQPRCPTEAPAPAQSPRCRQAVLDGIGELVAAVAGGVVPPEGGDRHRVAPDGFPPVLAMAHAQRRATACRCRHSSARPKLATDNPSWGAPRIHGGLLKLGKLVAQSTVAKYMPLAESGMSR